MLLLRLADFSQRLMSINTECRFSLKEGLLVYQHCCSVLSTDGQHNWKSGKWIQHFNTHPYENGDFVADNANASSHQQRSNSQ
ncbi:hypothetical protein Q3G72_029550 [Acer saccharum]|nr:hypothetical protein Q3G72_029550 [Acer saccharum]